ncbi:hypothetical protein [Streptomyces parvus]
MSFLALAFSALGLLVTVAPPTVRRATGPWWLAPPLVISAVAAIRWALLGSALTAHA